MQLIVFLLAAAALVGPTLGLKLVDLVGPYAITKVLDEESGELIKADAGATVEFLENFKVKGFSGCNKFRGAFSYAEGEPFVIPPLQSGKKECDGST